MQPLAQIIAQHPVFSGISAASLQLISGCARNVRIDPGQFLLRHGEPAHTLYLLRHGHVVLEIAAAGRGTLAMQTLGPGELVGLSWLLPPYQWSYDVRALELVRAVQIDADCLRRKSEADHDFGYDMMKRFMPVLVQRLQATRLQLLDVYGTGR